MLSVPDFHNDWATAYLSDAATVLTSLPESHVDAVVTDPPSGNAMVIPFQQSGDDSRYLSYDNPLGKLRYNFKTQNRVGIRLRQCFQESVWPVLLETARVLKPGGYGLFWGFNRTLHWLTWGLEDAGLAVLDIVVLQTPRQRPKVPTRKGRATQLDQQVELWLLVRKPGEPTALENEVKWGVGHLNIVESNGQRISNLMQRPSRGTRETSHPNEKSLEQMKKFVRLVTPVSGVVLDPFMGSGSTGVAAHAVGRRFIGIERDAKYFKEATDRLRDCTSILEEIQ